MIEVKYYNELCFFTVEKYSDKYNPIFRNSENFFSQLSKEVDRKTNRKDFCGETATKSNVSPQIFRCTEPGVI
jgi:hypothetical protein